MWIHYERLHNHNKATNNKNVCIFLGIYCNLPYFGSRTIWPIYGGCTILFLHCLLYFLRLLVCLHTVCPGIIDISRLSKFRRDFTLSIDILRIINMCIAIKDKPIVKHIFSWSDKENMKPPNYGYWHSFINNYLRNYNWCKEIDVTTHMKC